MKFSPRFLSDNERYFINDFVGLILYKEVKLRIIIFHEEY